LQEKVANLGPVPVCHDDLVLPRFDHPRQLLARDVDVSHLLLERTPLPGLKDRVAAEGNDGQLLLAIHSITFPCFGFFRLTQTHQIRQVRALQ